mgnify:CR=1 FL=1
MLADLNEKFFAAVSDGDDEMKAFIQARGQVDDEPGQDGGAVQVAQAETSTNVIEQVAEAAAAVSLGLLLHRVPRLVQKRQHSDLVS